MKSICLVLVAVGVVVSQSSDSETKAVAVLSKNGTGSVIGSVSFVQTKDCVVITGVLCGLIPGNHGFHVHEKADLSNGCASLGPHFNPFNKKHAAPTDEERHVGDLGNIVANVYGTAKFTIQDSKISLTDTQTNIIGRGLIVHEKADDLGRGGDAESVKTGNAGGRFACGIIKLV